MTKDGPQPKPPEAAGTARSAGSVPGPTTAGPARGFHGALSPFDLIGLQRSVGNQATARFVASRQPPPAPAAVQRTLERGSGTGWGAIGWVDANAKALWERL